jgi:hypothetical protein
MVKTYLQGQNHPFKSKKKVPRNPNGNPNQSQPPTKQEQN